MSQPAVAPADTRPARAPGAGAALIAVAGFSCLVVALQQTLVVPAVPVLPGLLGSSPEAVAWLVTATLLTGAVATPIIARLSDMFGRKPMMLIAMAFVLVGSALAPLGGITTLIIGRALQGLGTALVPVAMAQMRDSLPPHRTASALAILSATLGVGGGIGIPLGGVILDALGWQWLFWVSAALSIASILLIVRIVPASSAQRPGRFDLPGAVLLTAWLVTLLLALSQGRQWGWTSPATLSAAAIGAALMLLWGRRQLSAADPLVDLRTTASRPLLLTNLASLVLGVLMFTNLLLTTQQLQGAVSESGFGWSAAAAGLAMLPNAAAMFVVAPVTARLARTWGPRAVLMLGAAITAAGYLARMGASTSGATVIVWATVIGVGVGVGYAALPMLIVEYAPGPQIGEANGINALTRAVGTAIASSGVAAIGAVTAVTVHGAPSYTQTAYLTIAGLAGAGALVTVVLGALIRRSATSTV